MVDKAFNSRGGDLSARGDSLRGDAIIEIEENLSQIEDYDVRAGHHGWRGKRILGRSQSDVVARDGFN